MDIYTKYARIYPSIAGMIIPFVFTVIISGNSLSLIASTIGSIFSFVGIFLSSAIVYAALGYFLREMFRSISKWLFQFPLFKENETEMPTTKMLLWCNHSISTEYHQNISNKVAERFNIHLMTKEEEATDLVEAKHLIVSAVQNMRQVTRDDTILLQYNYEFGFCRNYLGASAVALVMLVILSVISLLYALLPVLGIIIFFVVQILLSTGAFISLRYRGNAYARYLFSAFMNK